MTDFTAAEKLACAERELKYRCRVYANLVASGHMQQSFADKQIATMKSIAEDYRVQAERERLL